MNAVEKILSAKAGVESVRPGDIAVCAVDKIVHLDVSFSVPGLDQVPRRIADPARTVVIMDHAVPAPTPHYATSHRKARTLAERFGLRIFDVGDHGICHQVILETGLAVPGQILACTDSHTCASGAFNCLARGVGPAEMLQITCKGRTWYQVSPTIQVELRGRPPAGVYGKDVFLYMAGVVGSAEGHNVEFTGSAIPDLTIDDRATIATMCAEISADFVLFPADEKIRAHLDGITDEPYEPVLPDPDAEYARRESIDLAGLVPYVSRPDQVPGNTLPAEELAAEAIRIDQAFVGSCANGKLEDLRVAAEVVAGRLVAPGVRFIVTPASQRVFKEALRAGYVDTLTEAGAVVTPSTCGACPGMHMGVLGDGEVCISSSTRNFKGRMGSPEASIYLASSATVAASAVTGTITDPRELLLDARAVAA